MHYYLIIALQGFCVYHCYTNRNNYYWIFAIIFLPVIGSLLYLFMNVFKRRDLEKAQDELVKTLNPTKKIKDLQKKLSFSETFENRVALADAYMENANYDEAIALYSEALKDMFANDYYVLSRLQEAYFKVSNFEKVLEISEQIKTNPSFKKSSANLIYAKILEKEGAYSEAEEQFRLFDAPYNYYAQRLELAQFLLRRDKKEDAEQVLQEIETEAQNMSRENYRNNKQTIKAAREILTSINTGKS
ncbi:PLDc N-terminal domain-containing protein [Croceivirga thetidis]|uniref:Cardiolipin synthase N-terminal domain-containing protein n=1 Tax=Croceivirga thetidis TaxID=2721623 RepID=A0ABX1GXG0_9FLAO|nr:hypothetical protein [Croceivirga thetidis]NKI33387.1 hypothetical protein [Croceivirga thetidis]